MFLNRIKICQNVCILVGFFFTLQREEHSDRKIISEPIFRYHQKSLKQKHNIRHPVSIKPDSFAEVNSTTVLI